MTHPAPLQRRVAHASAVNSHAYGALERPGTHDDAGASSRSELEAGHGALFKQMANVAIRKFDPEDSATFHWQGIAPDALPYDEWVHASRYAHSLPMVALSAYRAENGIKLKVTDWIDGIAEGRDRMAELDRSNHHGQIGGIGETVEHSLDDADRKAPVFEFRDAGNTTLIAAAETFAEIEREVRNILGGKKSL